MGSGEELGVRLRRRVLVVVTEVLAVIVLAWLSWWCWHRGVIITEHNGVALRRIEGRWWAVATGAATLAGILMLDALRQVTSSVHLVGRHPSEDEPRYR